MTEQASHPVKTRKKLIEVALPLDAINKASAREKSIRHGHPSTLHLWWARRPLAAARAVIFAQMVDDPSAHPDLFPTEKKQEKERLRLFKIIEALVLWKNTTNEKVLQAARDEIWQSWRRACADNVDHPHAKEMFDRNVLPAFHDPFAGGGALPLEAQRLGLESHASDLNPVAVLINKAMIEIPPKFAGMLPVNPQASLDRNLFAQERRGAKGLADDIRYYGQRMRDEAQERIGHLYPGVEVNAKIANDRPDLKPYVGQTLKVIAWLWARTIKSPNPAFSQVDVPLVSSYMLSNKAGKGAYVEPVVEDGGYRFTVKSGKPTDAAATKSGTKLSRGANFQCLMSGTPMAGDYIKSEGKAGRMGVRLMAIVAESSGGRVYLAPTPEHEAVALKAKVQWKPEVAISGSTQYLGVKPYSIDRFDQLFTNRQLVALVAFSDLIGEMTEAVHADALAAGLEDDGVPLCEGGVGAKAYSQAVGVYLTIALSRLTDICNSLCRWEVSKTQVRNLFGRQAIPMMWDFAENNVFGDAAGDYLVSLGNMAKTLERLPDQTHGFACQDDARSQSLGSDKVVSTDPPYYDNVPYADLSDFFYMWLRRSLRTVFPDLFATVAVPKVEELVAFAYRHEDRAGAEAFFVDGMTQAMQRLAKQSHPIFPVTIYYAFKQTESVVGEGTASTGWETFLEAVIQAGFATSGTWPIRTELSNRIRGQASNALASSVVLVCRPRPADAPDATRREFVTALKEQLPQALAHLQRGNIAPVDLAQAAIGPGMAVYTRYARVLDAGGKPLRVRQALALINQTLDEILVEQEGDFDADTRWAITWFEQSGFAEGEYGVAEQLSKSKNTSVQSMTGSDGILDSRRGKVRLLRPAELAADWDPDTDSRVTAWEVVHHIIRVLDSGGEALAAELVSKLGSRTGTVRELAYRLYALCERKKRAAEALAYNSLIQSWPEIERLAAARPSSDPAQQDMFNQE